MAIFPGAPAMPTVMLNVVLSLLPEGTYPVRGPDTLTVVSPMYNEEEGARAALESLLAQTMLPEEIAVSINGGTDNTFDVVIGTLRDFGYSKHQEHVVSTLGADLSIWQHPNAKNIVKILRYQSQTAKSDSINNLITHGIVASDRIIVVDGDTIFEANFIREMRDHFYRLSIKRTPQGPEYRLEDYAMQSGAVMSYAPPEASFSSKFISTGREAEYAFGCAIKNGQARQFGSSSLWGSSRVFTVIGCGFGARRDLFPMPDSTKTEDHDFTLTSQNLEAKSRLVSRDYLKQREFRIVVNGKELLPEQVMDKDDQIMFVEGGSVRFAPTAIMRTQDPPHLNGYLNQVERWFGGGQQNALKRMALPLRANTAYTIWSSIAENLLGIVLLLSIPLGLALNTGNPALGFMPSAVLKGLLLDIFIMTLMTGYGFYSFRRAEGIPRSVALSQAVMSALRTMLPFTVLRYLNPLPYIASAFYEIPHFLRQKHNLGSWERPSTKRKTRTQRLLVPGLVTLGLSSAALSQLAPHFDGFYLNQPLVQRAPEVTHVRHIDSFGNTGATLVAQNAKVTEPAPRVATVYLQEAVLHLLNGSDSARTLPNTGLELIPFMAGLSTLAATTPQLHELISLYCDPSFTLNIAAEPHSLAGNAEAYEPLSMWGLLTLARLVPLTRLVEGAATAYDLPVDFFLRVLLHESWLDPLAQGPTEDYGLSQVTDDAIIMLTGLSQERQGKYYNARLIPQNIDVFDPDFSVCAGAAKLAWAIDQPQADTERKAYALYINPLHGLQAGNVSPIHLPLTEGVLNTSMSQAVMNAYARYETAPETLTPAERELMELANDVRTGTMSTEQAYYDTYLIVQMYAIPDLEMYEKLFTNYYLRPLLHTAMR